MIEILTWKYGNSSLFGNPAQLTRLIVEPVDPPFAPLGGVVEVVRRRGVARPTRPEPSMKAT